MWLDNFQIPEHSRLFTSQADAQTNAVAAGNREEEEISMITEGQPQSEVIAMESENQAYYADHQEREVRDNIQRVWNP
jgi:hypothetical protein